MFINKWLVHFNSNNTFAMLSGQGPSLLSPGIHSFPFKLGLPHGLPSTFLGKHGWVQYFCKAALREPNGLTHKNQQVFIVMNPIDLNLEPPILSVNTTRLFKCVYNYFAVSWEVCQIHGKIKNLMIFIISIRILLVFLFN